MLLGLQQAVLGHRTPVLPPLDFAVAPGQRVAVLGPNGGGKTTFLKSLIGLLPLLAGTRSHAGLKTPRVGYVPQAHRADPAYPLTTLEVVLQGALGLVGVGRWPGRTHRADAREQLARVGLSEQADTPFRTLSGGQRQRALLARALCARPELLALDEFTSELDPAASSALLEEVTQLAGEGVALLFVTHAISDAVGHATHAVLADGASQVFEAGPAESLLTGDRLGRLYGQHVHLETREGRTVVFMEAGGRR